METPRLDRDLGQRGDGAGRYFTREQLERELAKVEDVSKLREASVFYCPRCLSMSAHAGRCDKCLDQSRLGNE